MAKEIINVGTTPNDGTGDLLRNAFEKVNNNFNQTFSEYNYLTSNFTLPDSTSFLGQIVLVNIGTSNITINTEVADKLNGEDSFVLYPEESLTIVKEDTNKYRVV